MSIGIRTGYIAQSDTLFVSDTVFRTIGLTSPIAAGQTQHIIALVVGNVPATSGWKWQLFVPAGGILFSGASTFNPTDLTQGMSYQAASASVANNAGNVSRFMKYEATIVNGPNAGNIDLRFAQSASSVNVLTILRGASMEVIILP